jgi:glycosyltransferase involved in cell wall biosynthesis
MMKILYAVHQFFPKHHTGTERLTLQIAKQMQRMGHSVHIITYEPDELDISKLDVHDKIFIQTEHVTETIPVTCFKKRKNEIGWDHVFDSEIESLLSEFVQQFDIVHFMHPQIFASVLKLCKKYNIPTVLTLTDNWLLCPFGLLNTKKELCDGPDEGKKCITNCSLNDDVLTRYDEAKYFFNNVDAVFTGTDFIRTTFSLNNWNREIFLNPFSVDYSYVNSLKNSEELVFGFIGSLMWHKGLHVLIDAFKQLKHKKIKLKIYGIGAEGDPYQKQIIKSIKSDSRMEYCGTFDYSELSSVLSNISTIIIPSTYKEIFPLVMQTAFAFKIPVIASNIGGMPEIIHDNKNGFLFELGNSIELSNILNKICENPTILESLQKNIVPPPRVEQEAFRYFLTYTELLYP